MIDYLLVRKVGAGFYTISLHPVCPAHEGIQGILQCLIIPGNRPCAVYVSCHRHKAVCGTGQIDFQSVLPVVDVVHSLIIGKIRRETEKAAQTCARGRSFKIGIRKEGHDGCRHIIQRTILTDAVVDINRANPLGYTVPDPVPTAQRIGLHGSAEVRKRRRIVGPGQRTGLRIIGNLCRFPLSFLHFPHAEGSVVFQLLRDVYKVHFTRGHALAPLVLPYSLQQIRFHRFDPCRLHRHQTHALPSQTVS